jgi:hypothetical protein
MISRYGQEIDIQIEIQILHVWISYTWDLTLKISPPDITICDIQ